MFEKLIERGFQFQFQYHAQAILEVDFPDALTQLEKVLTDVTIPVEEIIASGGGEAPVTQRLRKAFSEAGWNKVTYVMKKTLNNVEKETQSHIMDHIRSFERGDVALEIEWNNKDPFYDRDLEKFKRIHAEGGISVGVIVTRGTSLQEELRNLALRFARERNLQNYEDYIALGFKRPTARQQNDVEIRMRRVGNFAEAWSQCFVSDKYGKATTHWEKLQVRVQRGVGNPCPLLLIGLPASIVSFAEPVDIAQLEETEPIQPEADTPASD